MANDQYRAHWNRSGSTWVEHQETFEQMLARIGTLLVDTADPQEGERILDVGCGFGSISMALVAAGAVVHGVDISEPMTAAARARVPSASFSLADAQTDPLDGPYDKVVSRLGVMFFDDPLAAFANIAHHTVPGGRLTFACWNDLHRSSGVTAGAEVIRAALPDPPPPPTPRSPGPFGLADAQWTRAVLEHSCWTDVSIVGHEVRCTIGRPDSDGVEERLAVVLASEAGQLMREQIPERERPAIIEAARRALRERVVDGALELVASIWLVTAVRA